MSFDGVLGKISSLQNAHPRYEGQQVLYEVDVDIETCDCSTTTTPPTSTQVDIFTYQDDTGDILRYFNVAGASPSGKIGEIESSHGHLIKNLAIQYYKKNPRVNIYGNDYNTKDGTCIRDYIHVTDLANIHIKALKKISSNKKSLILNCGYGKGYSVKEIVNIFKKIKKNVKVYKQNRRKGDVAQIYSDITRLKKVLKWRPKFNNIKFILKSSINWEKNEN